MTYKRSAVIFVHGGDLRTKDWVGMYIDGKLFEQDAKLDPAWVAETVLAMDPKPVVGSVQADPKWFEEMCTVEYGVFNLPDRLGSCRSFAEGWLADEKS